jgi:hypothetical protein
LSTASTPLKSREKTDRVLNFKDPKGVAFQLVEQPASRLGALHPYGRGAQFG